MPGPQIRMGLRIPVETEWVGVLDHLFFIGTQSSWLTKIGNFTCSALLMFLRLVGPDVCCICFWYNTGSQIGNQHFIWKPGEHNRFSTRVTHHPPPPFFSAATMITASLLMNPITKPGKHQSNHKHKYKYEHEWV